MQFSQSEAALFLSQIRGINLNTYSLIINSKFDLADELTKQIENKSSKISEFLQKDVLKNLKEYLYSKSFEVLLRKLKYFDIEYIYLNSPAYPVSLKNIFDPPKILFYKGNIDLLNSRKLIAVVGTRKCSSYGRRVAKDITAGLVDLDYTIVSGMAFGIDACAHLSALDNNGNTIAVLAGGVEKASPSGNESIYRKILDGSGLIISEYPPGYGIVPGLFPRRSRIISGLCNGVVVVEAGEKSGALIAAKMALEQGREVFSIPGSIYSSSSIGTNRLVKEGCAKLIQSIGDIVEELENEVVLEKSTDLAYSPLEKSIVDMVSNQPMSVDDLVRSINISISEALSALSLMEIEGKISKNDQGQYFI